MSGNLIEAVREGWGWTGIQPIRVAAVSHFGHLVIEDEQHRFWYLDQELRKLDVVAVNEAELDRYFDREEVREVWQAQALVEAARQRLGVLDAGRCYTLTPAALLAGDFNHDKLITLPIAELIRFTGTVQQQTQHLPAGTQIRLAVTD